jgi:hypothetical protein
MHREIQKTNDFWTHNEQKYEFSCMNCYITVYVEQYASYELEIHI